MGRLFAGDDDLERLVTRLGMAVPAILAMLALVATACSTSGELGSRPADQGIESIPDESSSSSQPRASARSETSPLPQASPEIVAGGEAWRTIALEDVRTGETFSIADLAGKLVAIEPMAIWCSNCLIQQHEAVAALAQVDSDDLVYIGVDVDPNERARALARYSQEQGFDWPFVVASRDLARSLARSFGDQVLAPPSTPLILVGPQGDVLDVHFGIRRADELAAVLREQLPTG